LNEHADLVQNSRPAGTDILNVSRQSNTGCFIPGRFARKLFPGRDSDQEEQLLTQPENFSINKQPVREGILKKYIHHGNTHIFPAIRVSQKFFGKEREPGNTIGMTTGSPLTIREIGK